MPATSTIDELKTLQAKHTRLISFEPSHSWLKRYDSEGALVVQAGFRLNPNGRTLKNDENRHLLIDGHNRYYGSIACQGQHESPLTQRKENTARLGFAACLRPSDDGKDLVVCVSHWDEDTGKAIAESLKGHYDATVNGRQIRCRVVSAISQLEDEGTYQLLKPRLKPGRTLLVGMGHGTSQEWIIEPGDFFTGRATEALAVSHLVKQIADDQGIRAHALKLGEQSVNLDLVTQALRTGQFGSMPREHWEAISQKYIGQWFDGLKGYLLKTYSSELQSISNVVLSGGGAELIRDRAGKFALIPDDAQIASAKGAYLHHSVLSGVA